MKTATKGPLEWLKLKDYCEMCGHRINLEAAFDPRGVARTLCDQCRIGSAELLRDQRAGLLSQLRIANDNLSLLHSDRLEEEHPECRSTTVETCGCPLAVNWRSNRAAIRKATGEGGAA